MNTAEVIKPEVQGDCGFQIVQLFRESVGQSGKAAHLHPHGQILPFNVASGDVFRIGPTIAHFGYNLRDASWGVPFIAELAIVAVQFDELRVVRTASKGVLDCAFVKVKAVRGELAAVSDSFFQIGHELIRGIAAALANGKRRNEFGFRVDGHKYPLIAALGGIVFADLPLLLKAESPDFIALDVVAFQVAHSRVQQPLAAFPGHDEQTHDGVAMQPCKPLCRAQGATFNQALDGAESRSFIYAHCKGRSGFGVGKGCGAGRTAVTLDSVPSVAAKLFDRRVLAFNARHGVSPLALCGETSQNIFGSD
jgi:hypothetical protein